jgi:hypothetical protein
MRKTGSSVVCAQDRGPEQVLEIEIQTETTAAADSDEAAARADQTQDPAKESGPAGETPACRDA